MIQIMLNVAQMTLQWFPVSGPGRLRVFLRKVLNLLANKILVSQRAGLVDFMMVWTLVTLNTTVTYVRSMVGKSLKY